MAGPAPDTTRGEEWQCPRCGEWVPATFRRCWSCADGMEPVAEEEEAPAEDPAERDRAERLLKIGLAFDLFCGALIASDLVLNPAAFSPLALIVIVAVAVVLGARLRQRTREGARAERDGPEAGCVPPAAGAPEDRDGGG